MTQIVNNAVHNDSRQTLKTDTRHRRYMLTINNPLPAFNHEKIKELLTHLKLSYYCLADEISPENETYHTHLYFESEKNAIRFSTVQKMFFTANIQSAYGTGVDCRDYVGKFGKWYETEKRDTSVDGTFYEWGEIPQEKSNQGKRTDWDIAREMLQDGNHVYDVINTFPHMIKHNTHLGQLRQAIVEEEFRDVFRHLDITYIQGATGVGKTRYVMEKYGYREVCKITSYKHGCFDKYKCEDVMLFDEFASKFEIQDMLNYLDGYPLDLQCKYFNRIACYTKVYIISNIALEEQYAKVKKEQPEVYKAFLRRIDNVMVFTDCGKHKTYTTDEYFKSLEESQLTEESFNLWADSVDEFICEQGVDFPL